MQVCMDDRILSSPWGGGHDRKEKYRTRASTTLRPSGYSVPKSVVFPNSVSPTSARLTVNPQAATFGPSFRARRPSVTDQRRGAESPADGAARPRRGPGRGLRAPAGGGNR
eukprot:762830-Hanusia_phi.AAC.4